MVNLHWQKLSPDFQWGEILDDVVKIHIFSYSHFHTFQQSKTSFFLSSLQLAMSDSYESKSPRQWTPIKPSFLSCWYYPWQIVIFSQWDEPASAVVLLKIMWLYFLQIFSHFHGCNSCDKQSRMTRSPTQHIRSVALLTHHALLSSILGYSSVIVSFSRFKGFKMVSSLAFKKYKWIAQIRNGAFIKYFNLYLLQHFAG